MPVSGLRRAGFVVARASAALATLYALSLTTRIWSGPVGRDLEARGAPLSLLVLCAAWVATGVFVEIAGMLWEVHGAFERDDPRQQWASTLSGAGLSLVVVSIAGGVLLTLGVFDVRGPLPLVLAGASSVLGASWMTCAGIVAALHPKRP